VTSFPPEIWSKESPKVLIYRKIGVNDKEKSVEKAGEKRFRKSAVPTMAGLAKKERGGRFKKTACFL
jgi:hypothetical protein